MYCSIIITFYFPIIKDKLILQTDASDAYLEKVKWLSPTKNQLQQFVRSWIHANLHEQVQEEYFSFLQIQTRPLNTKNIILMRTITTILLIITKYYELLLKSCRSMYSYSRNATCGTRNGCGNQHVTIA